MSPCRWFDQWGLSSESEKHQQKQVQSITDPANLVCEMVPFEFKKPGCNPEIKQAEFGYVADLNQFVQLHLDENEKYNSLTFYTVMNVTIAAMSIIVNVKKAFGTASCKNYHFQLNNRLFILGMDA